MERKTKRKHGKTEREKDQTIERNEKKKRTILPRCDTRETALKEIHGKGERKKKIKRNKRKQMKEAK